MIFAFIFLLIHLNSVFAYENITIDIEENGKITSYYDEYYVVHVEGNMSVTNPANVSLYGITIKLSLGSLNVIELESGGYLSTTEISILQLDALETLVVPYKIIGISLTDPAIIYGCAGICYFFR